LSAVTLDDSIILINANAQEHKISGIITQVKDDSLIITSGSNVDSSTTDVFNLHLSIETGTHVKMRASV
jgi:hypothetical protein